jgi:hypothetical protein
MTAADWAATKAARWATQMVEQKVAHSVADSADVWAELSVHHWVERWGAYLAVRWDDCSADPKVVRLAVWSAELLAASSVGAKDGSKVEKTAAMLVGCLAHCWVVVLAGSMAGLWVALKADWTVLQWAAWTAETSVDYWASYLAEKLEPLRAVLLVWKRAASTELKKAAHLVSQWAELKAHKLVVDWVWLTVDLWAFHSVAWLVST